LITERRHELNLHLTPRRASRANLVRSEIRHKPPCSLERPTSSALLHLRNRAEFRCELRADLSDDLGRNHDTLNLKLIALYIRTGTLRTPLEGESRRCTSSLSPPQRPATGDECSGVVQIGVKDLYRLPLLV
jgi:hypothetical protein